MKSSGLQRCTLFEVSWEVCNKVGGVNMVLATKAKTMVDKFGDRYVAVGPWLLDERVRAPFDEEEGFAGFCAACREAQLAVRVGRWRVPGRPRTILVGFSGLYERKDELLAELWERHRVDSLTGGWDYLEPLLFGQAAGMVLERWWQEFVAPAHSGAVAHCHDWHTGAGLLYLADKLPEIGTVFTSHATVLGRALAAGGQAPAQALGDREPERAAEELGVRSKHSLEGAAARQADVFTTVSEITSEEAELFYERRAFPILPNGIDLEVAQSLAGPTSRIEARARLQRFVSSFLGEDLSAAALLTLAGRYEFHNKGIDVLLEALAQLQRQPGRSIVLLLLVPAGNSGLRKEVAQRFRDWTGAGAEPLGIATHNLFDQEQDAIHAACHRLGLHNPRGARVKVIHVPAYLNGDDGLLDLSYEAVLSAMDMSCFPSFYEPWGYTAMESLAFGVPTVTTDCAGFGRWAEGLGLGQADGVYVLPRLHAGDQLATQRLAEHLEKFLAAGADRTLLAESCRNTALKLTWKDLLANHETAFREALVASAARRAERPAPRRPAPAKAHPTQGAKRPNLVRFQVAATLPKPLNGLLELAANLWWSWDPEAPVLFAELSPGRWERCNHNPIVLLRDADADDLAAKSADPEYLARLERVLLRFRAYVDAAGERKELGSGLFLSRYFPVAYFCLEFGVHQSLRIYSGGLGVLAGDHLKSASDLNLPLVGVGLLYRRGYLRQRLASDGEQIADEDLNDPHEMPLQLVRDSQGEPIVIDVQLPASTLRLQAWKAQVGRVPLYLLDSDRPDNGEADRSVTHRLYSGGTEGRIRQEIVLGKGGVRLLKRLGIEPAVVHMNEGHAAFCALERTAQLIQRDGLTFDQARELVMASTAFTTHTPVPAGHDLFGEDLMRRYFSNSAEWIGLPWERFMALGTVESDQSNFNMTNLAARFSASINGVSRRNGEVARALLRPLWPGLLENEVPVGHVTNGVHLPTWTDPQLARLLGAADRGAGAADFKERSRGLAAAELWRARRGAKHLLLEAARAHLERNFLERHDSPRLMARILDGLDGDALYLGFARRFAPYKRATLLFKDLERLVRIVNDPERPVRLLFAGKAHPADQRGREILKQVAALSRSEQLAGRLLFLENYDLELARRLVQGVDVWLNTPTRPQEASGTSGMKAAANGVLNLSVLDGWWIEGYDGANGWALGDQESYTDQELQDQFDNGLLLSLLEQEIVPLYFQRDEQGVPAAWLEKVKRSLETIPPLFNTDRMVQQYFQEAYHQLARNFFELRAAGNAKARALAKRRARVLKAFPQVKVSAARTNDLDKLCAGDSVQIEVDIELAELRPEDLRVEFVLGHDAGQERLHHMATVPLQPVSSHNGVTTFQGSHVVSRSGSYGYGIRARIRETEPWDLGFKDATLWA